MMISMILQAALTALFSLSFPDGPVPGVESQAAFFDGSSLILWPPVRTDDPLEIKINHK